MIDDVLLRAVCRALCDHVRSLSPPWPIARDQSIADITSAIEAGALDFLPGVTRPCRKREDPTARIALPTLGDAMEWHLLALGAQQKPVADQQKPVVDGDTPPQGLG